jgi:hypothetical protein
MRAHDFLGSPRSCGHAWPLAQGKRIPGPQRLARPNHLRFDFRIAAEQCRHMVRPTSGRRQPQIDGIAEVFARKAKTQADDVLTNRPLDRHLARLHAFGNRLRPRPQGRSQAAFRGQRRNDPPLRHRSKQADRLVKARLARAVHTGDQVQPLERQHDVPQRPVSGYGDLGKHPWLTVSDQLQHNRPRFRKPGSSCRPIALFCRTKTGQDAPHRARRHAAARGRDEDLAEGIAALVRPTCQG